MGQPIRWIKGNWLTCAELKNTLHFTKYMNNTGIINKFSNWSETGLNSYLVIWVLEFISIKWRLHTRVDKEICTIKLWIDETNITEYFSDPRSKRLHSVMRSDHCTGILSTVFPEKNVELGYHVEIFRHVIGKQLVTYLRKNKIVVGITMRRNQNNPTTITHFFTIILHLHHKRYVFNIRCRSTRTWFC